MPNVLLIGNGAREHALAEALKRSGRDVKLSSYMKSMNPGIASLSESVFLGGYGDLAAIKRFAADRRADFAVVGPEDPLQQGVVDSLLEAGVPSVGPSRAAARLETSKSFTRDLLEKYGIPGNPKYRVFFSEEGIAGFIKELDSVVIKPDGLTGGKGVMVQGDHFQTKAEALRHCREILKSHPCVIVEEKLEGEEFSLQCISDGKTVVATPPVQDHKRRFVDDKGPNTGGMGSYSCEDHSLPFMSRKDAEEGLRITQKVAQAIERETGQPYRGVMYGGFIITRNGLRLLEYNARFGDPEAMNILPILKSNFVEICSAVLEGTLDRVKVEFEKKATVCKYVVPKGYGLPKDHPDSGSTGARIELGDAGESRIYFSSVDQRADGLHMTSSRAVGVVGIAADIAQAEQIAEKGVRAIRGPVDHRPDIGTKPLLLRRVKHMKELKKE